MNATRAVISRCCFVAGVKGRNGPGPGEGDWGKEGRRETRKLNKTQNVHGNNQCD